jgi:hypothetical protein
MIEPRSRIRTAAWILGGATLSMASCVALVSLFAWLMPSGKGMEAAIGYLLLAVPTALVISCFGVGILVGRYAGSAAAAPAGFTAGVAFAAGFQQLILGWGEAVVLTIVFVAFACFGAALAFAGGALGAWWARSSRSAS